MTGGVYCEKFLKNFFGFFKKSIDNSKKPWYNITVFGGVAQLGERTVRIRKVESSILFVSTTKIGIL